MHLFSVHFKEKIKKSKKIPIVLLANLYVELFYIQRCIRKFTSIPIFYLCRFLPLQEKIVATTFSGKKYGDNPQNIIEKIHAKDPSLKIIWLKDFEHAYSTPDYIKVVSFFSYWRKAYELATAKVWIYSHHLEDHIKKRHNQFFVETWHGGLGVKKIEMDSERFQKSPRSRKDLKTTVHHADLFISNSNHLTQIYRNAFQYKGPIWQIGYPKNDILLNESERKKAKNKIHKAFALKENNKIIVYAPTFRDDATRYGIKNSIYDINFKELKKCLENHFKGSWTTMIRLHPVMKNYASLLINDKTNVIDATKYEDAQEIILAADAFISDYSSMIFDAAITGIPCFTFAKDYSEYEKGRGLYYKLEDLPFSLATTNAELINNISNFDNDKYHSKWNDFKTRMGLIETDCSAEKIANLIIDVIKNGKDVIPNHIKEL